MVSNPNRASKGERLVEKIGEDAVKTKKKIFAGKMCMHWEKIETS